MYFFASPSNVSPCRNFPIGFQKSIRQPKSQRKQAKRVRTIAGAPEGREGVFDFLNTVGTFGVLGGTLEGDAKLRSAARRRQFKDACAKRTLFGEHPEAERRRDN